MKLLFFVPTFVFFSQLIFASPSLNFLNYCLHSQQNPDIQVTVKALLDISDTCDCHKAYDRLKEKKFLSLESSQITSILPLSGLNNLETLDLSDNKIKSLWGLENLASLKVLFLAHNGIEDVTALGLLEKIEVLDLSHNSIRKVAPIKDISAIKILHIHDNPIFDDEEAMDYLEGLIYFRKLQQRGMDYVWPPESVEEAIVDINGASKRGDLKFIRKIWQEQSLRVAVSMPSFFDSLEIKTKKALMAVKYSSEIAENLVRRYKEISLPQGVPNSPQIIEYFEIMKNRLSLFFQYFIMESDHFPFQESDLKVLENYLLNYIQKNKSMNLETFTNEIKRWVSQQSQSQVPITLKSGFYSM